MKNFTKMILATASVAGLMAVGAPAIAQDAPEFSLAGTVAVQSDYRFRGISQSNRSFAPQGSLTLTGPDGFYVSGWASTVDFDPGNGSQPYVEVDIYGGKHTDLWGVDWNFMPYYYAYPSAPGGSQPDYFELINQLSYTSDMGLGGTVTWAWSPNFTYDSGTANYLALMLSYPINDWLSVSGNFGHQWVQAAKTLGSSDYNHGDVGVTASYQGFALDLRYNLGTDLNAGGCANFYMTTRNACSGNFVATLTYNIALFP